MTPVELAKAALQKMSYLDDPRQLMLGSSDYARGFNTCSVQIAKDVREALAALEAEGADGWRPIESAPKDGEFLIAYKDGTVRMGHYLDNSARAFPFEGVRPLHGVERARNLITHWMPLPSPPVLVDEEGAGDVPT